MVWPSSAQGIRPSEREVYPNHIGVSLSRLSPPPLFCSPYRSRLPSGVEGPLVYPERSRGVTPSNSFRSNTYRIIWKCSFQKTYRNSKSFRSNTYKKTGVGGLRPLAPIPVFIPFTPSVFNEGPLVYPVYPELRGELSRGTTLLRLRVSVPLWPSSCAVVVPLVPRWSPVVLRRKTPSIPFFFILLPDSCRPNEGGVHAHPPTESANLCVFTSLRCPQEPEIRPGEGGLLSSPATSHRGYGSCLSASVAIPSCSSAHTSLNWK